MAEGVGRLQAASRAEAPHRRARSAAGGAEEVIGRILLALALGACATPAGAQNAQPVQPAQGTQIEFLPRYAFHVSMEYLASDERRFEWDAHWGGDLDIVDYGYGRFNFVADYQTILGDEFREFDPNQGNYILEGS